MGIRYNTAPGAWYSRKHALVAMSTAEAEYIAVESAIQTATNLYKMMVQSTLWEHRSM